ncbi:pyruvate kinase [Tyzzerella sp. An114]|uniref:pyruvate kinase n=1 Tax=Tyzzerella sp. An114 TaxID=1965545 RepID=UPI000B433265|nr:pyruvate kinase [Tyzzerella sp. An114]OUQ60440.1 pyruvate kinase [Tyzzerella sp. An114]HIT72396.1 pyruvate kinase [Candidatus Fimicola cottocaccae]
MRRTKIVCTLGPATSSVEIMKELIKNGLDAARVNFSHGTHESHSVIINMLKQAREELNAPIPLILDTKGPEIRIKKFGVDKIYLERGQKFTLTTRDVEGTQDIVSVTYADLPKDLEVDSRVLLDDGLVELKVEEIKGTDILCRVENGGFLSSNKGVNVPDIYVNLPALTEKDIDDIKFGIKMGFDYIFASFIRSASDIINIKRVLEENGGSDIQVIAKIESRDGVNNINEILEVADGIMVARGDLGVEIPTEEVPLVQKDLIKRANYYSKPVITATQMLESMVTNPRPTRAEANDVANAIFDGTDAIMLSGETAKGDYPVQAVATMARIAEKTESSIDYVKELSGKFTPDQTNITNAISYAACTTAAELHTACICSLTKSGFTARMISKFRPACPISACAMDEMIWRQLNLVWGCRPSLYKQPIKSDEVFDVAMKMAVSSGLAENGDTCVMAIGVPVGVSGSTNTLRVEIVGDVIAKGVGIGTKKVSGKTRVIKVASEASRKFKTGDILVTTSTNNELLPYMKKASAIVVGPVTNPENCHAEIVGRALDIPVVMCNAKVIDFIANDALITVDPVKGFIYSGRPE